MLKILYEDAELIAVEKPAGLLVHPSFLAKRDEPSAMKLLRDQIGKWVYPVHRLDRPTSGVLLFALSSESANDLALSFQSREMKKTYHAIVRGWVPVGAREVHNKPLKKLESGTGAVVLQEASTEYESIEQFELPIPNGEHPTSRFSLVKAHPITGRWHQIRRHFARASHPLVGDVLYGDGKQNRIFREHLKIHRLLLHCTELQVPRNGEEMLVLRSELPEEFLRRTIS